MATLRGMGLGQCRDSIGVYDFYCKVGPKLAARVGETRNGGFLKYKGNRVKKSLNWSPTTPAVEVMTMMMVKVIMLMTSMMRIMIILMMTTTMMMVEIELLNFSFTATNN